MAYWLLKSEPESWSWEDQKRAGSQGTEWTGVRNYQARNHMRAMQPGERAFFYHSGAAKAIVGIVEVVGPAHPDSTDRQGKWDCVDVKAVADLKHPVALDACKADRRLKAMVLVNNSRLSVQPVGEAEWQVICELGGIEA